MAEFPAMPLWTDAYLADTGHLTGTEHGAYLLLLITAWRSGGALPNDDVRLARYTRLDIRQWRRIKPTILEFFHADPSGQLRQSRLDDELQAVRHRSKKQSDNARSKYRKTKEITQAAAQPIADLAKPNTSQTDASIPISISILKKEKSSLRSEPAKAGGHPTKSEGFSVSDFMPDGSTLPVDEVRQAIDAYNDDARRSGWASANWPLSDARKRAVKARLHEAGGIDGWRTALDKALASDFLSGRAPRGEGHGNWKVDLSWFVKAENFTKIMEGKYDGNTTGGTASRGGDSIFASMARVLAARTRERQREPDADDGVFPAGQPSAAGGESGRVIEGEAVVRRP